jgi:hypothetical protein
VVVTDIRVRSAAVKLGLYGRGQVVDGRARLCRGADGATEVPVGAENAGGRGEVDVVGVTTVMKFVELHVGVVKV